MLVRWGLDALKETCNQMNDEDPDKRRTEKLAVLCILIESLKVRWNVHLPNPEGKKERLRKTSEDSTLFTEMQIFPVAK